MFPINIPDEANQDLHLSPRAATGIQPTGNYKTIIKSYYPHSYTASQGHCGLHKMTFPSIQSQLGHP